MKNLMAFTIATLIASAFIGFSILIMDYDHALFISGFIAGVIVIIVYRALSGPQNSAQKWVIIFSCGLSGFIGAAIQIKIYEHADKTLTFVFYLITTTISGLIFTSKNSVWRNALIGAVIGFPSYILWSDILCKINNLIKFNSCDMSFETESFLWGLLFWGPISIILGAGGGIVGGIISTKVNSRNIISVVYAIIGGVIGSFITAVLFVWSFVQSSYR